VKAGYFMTKRQSELNGLRQNPAKATGCAQQIIAATVK